MEEAFSLNLNQFIISTPFSKANALFKIYAVTKLIKLEHIYFFSMKENSLTFLLIPFIDD